MALTAFERQQPQHVFVHAGKTAFQIGVPIQNNPYKEKPYRDLWDKGYRAAKRLYEQKRGIQARPASIHNRTKPEPPSKTRVRPVHDHHKWKTVRNRTELEAR